MPHRLKGPVFGKRSACGPDSAGIDPCFQCGDLFGREWRTNRRHGGFLLPRHLSDQQSAGEDVLRGLTRIQPQTAHVRLLAMAGNASLGQNRLNVFDEIDAE